MNNPWMFWWINLNTFLVNSGLQTKIEVLSFHAWSWLRTFTICRVRYYLPTAISFTWDCQQIMIPYHLYKNNTISRNFVNMSISVHRQRAKPSVNNKSPCNGTVQIFTLHWMNRAMGPKRQQTQNKMSIWWWQKTEQTLWPCSSW